jgi:thiosulfate/3-mercaptopyruvate sulfurtransferase
VEQLAPHEKVFVDEEFMEDENHGDLTCADCHGGDPTSLDFKAAHTGVQKDPSYPAPGICADCHDEQSEHYETSLHYSLAPFEHTIMTRGTDDPEIKAGLKTAMGNHCAKCHASCGQCHVSRPDSVGGGFLSGHLISKNPSERETCTACHGSRVGDEYFGKSKSKNPPDVHRQKAFMKCKSCHKAEQIHGSGKQYTHRRQVENAPRCQDCHEEIYTEKGENIETHEIHQGKVACQVCHSQTYQNCFGCHVKQNKETLACYFKVERHEFNFKIGLNPNKTKRHPETFVTLRHAPIAKDTFDFYAKNALGNFDSLPTWKPATPHNIRRKTPQNKSCDSCHGNEELFLTAKDVEKEHLKANKPVIVPREMIPEKVGE